LEQVFESVASGQKAKLLAINGQNNCRLLSNVDFGTHPHSRHQILSTAVVHYAEKQMKVLYDE
jgi:hypothetical protein